MGLECLQVHGAAPFVGAPMTPRTPTPRTPHMVAGPSAHTAAALPPPPAAKGKEMAWASGRYAARCGTLPYP